MSNIFGAKICHSTITIKERIWTIDTFIGNTGKCHLSYRTTDYLEVNLSQLYIYSYSNNHVGLSTMNDAVFGERFGFLILVEIVVNKHQPKSASFSTK